MSSPETLQAYVNAVTEAERAREPYACRSRNAQTSASVATRTPLTFENATNLEAVKFFNDFMRFAGRSDDDRCAVLCTVAQSQ